MGPKEGKESSQPVTYTFSLDNHSETAHPLVSFQKSEVEQSLCSRFEHQVDQYPDRIAVKTHTAVLTYDSLNAAANRVARSIAARVTEGQKCVAYFLSDDSKTIIAFLAILKSGNIYVPLDPEHPPIRNARILDDAEAQLILTDSESFAAAQALSPEANLLNIDTISASVSGENLELGIRPESLAYIIYTSGSTGEPKGVVQNHRNILFAVMNISNTLNLAPSDRITLFSARTTAQAMTITFSALLNGAAIFPFKPREIGLDRLASWLIQEEITIYHSITSIFNSFVRTLDGTEQFPHLRVLKLGGEPVSRREFQLYKKHFSRECLFVNSLSCTEAGTFCQYFADHDTEISSSLMPVGYPVPYMDLFLVTDSGHPAGPGEVGEIVVCSRYHTPGYWKKPSLTTNAFFPDPVASELRILRTGDLGRASEDGCIYHLGRKDFQVKIRGNRIELAEIEVALRDIPSVEEAVVATRKDKHGEPFLVAYVVPATQTKPTAASLRTLLRKTLTDQSVPSAFVFMEALPTTPAGKVDRLALPETQVVEDHLAPRTPVEGHLVRIWEEILGVHPIGVQDDFFELGGNSLSAARVMNYIESDFGERFPISTFFTAATVEEFAKLIPQARSKSPSSALTQIQGGDSTHPFFFVHGQFNGGGFYCIKLAHHLGENCSFYALQPLGPQDQSLPPSIEVMAASYIELVRSVQPHGPYLLGGYCNGGLIAFEMAQQLTAVGETVNLVAIINSVARNIQYRKVRKMAVWISQFTGTGPADQIDWFIHLRSFARQLQEASGWGRLTFVLNCLKHIPATLAFFVRDFRRNRKAARGAAGVQLISVADDPRWEDRTPHYTRIVTSYVPQPYSGAIALFRSEQENSSQSPSMGWHEVTSKLKVYAVPGGHSTCITEPANLAVLAKDLKTCLEEYSVGEEDPYESS